MCDRMIGPYKCCSVVCGDCLELMKQLPLVCECGADVSGEGGLYHAVGGHENRSAIDLCITDPPYGIAVNNDWQNEIHAKRGSALNIGRGAIANDKGEITPDCLRQFKNRVVFGHPYLLDADATGWLVWDKEPGFEGRSLTSPVEMAYSTTWRGFRAIRLLWSGYMRHPGAEEKVGHPTQKPISLMAQIIDWHPDAESILDPFCGSGTTLVAAKKLSRHFLGFEISPEYCEIARDRLARIDAQPSLFTPKPEQMELGGGE